MPSSAQTNWLAPSRWVDGLRLSRQEVDAFPNRLTDPAPERPPLPRAWLTLALLVAVTLLPRVAMALRIPTICTDGTVYVSLAVQRDSGRYDPAEIHINNIYPRILSALHAAGLSWEVAGKSWGVLCAALAVLPLFGFVRRQFNDRVAVVICVIYAVHPELIEWSPELVRDQTFWLLFTASLYCLWRAAVEVSVGFHLAAAVTVPLCVWARFEGVFLVIPYVCWTAVRLYYLQTGRRRFVVSWAIVLLLFASVVVSTGRGREAVANLAHLRPWQRAQAWWSGTTPTAAAASPASPVASKLTLTKQVRLYYSAVSRGLTELTGALILIGLALHWRLFVRSDHLPLLLLSFAICGGIWIHLWYSGGEASSRYSLAIAILGMRAAAVCVMRLVDGLAILAGSWPRGLRTATLMTPLCLLMVIGLIDALNTNYDGRLAKAELGRWIERTYGENSRLAGEAEQLPIVGFYAHTGHTLLATVTDVESWVGQIRAGVFDVVLVSRRCLPGATYQLFVDRLKTLGLELTEPDLSVPLKDDTTVLSRAPIRR